MDAVEKTTAVKAVETKPTYTMPDGRVLYMLYSPNCTDPCITAKAAVEESGVPVVQLNVYEEPFEAIKLWQGTELEFAVPAWVLVENDKPIKRWVGATPKTSVRMMAEYKTGPVIYASPVQETIVYERGVPQQVIRTTTNTPAVRMSIPPARRTWTYSGSNLASHLAQSHGINPAGMSYQDMVNAHSHAHERTWNSAYAARQQEYYVQRSQPARVQRTFTPVRNFFGAVLGVGGCPSGACPR